MRDNYGQVGDNMTNNFFGCHTCGCDTIDNAHMERLKRRARFCDKWGGICMGATLLCMMTVLDTNIFPDVIETFLLGIAGAASLLSLLIFAAYPQK
jgi:uncharacterized membrane protein